ncbi:Ion channel [Lotmaria passim]
MELRSRVEKLTQLQTPTVVPPASTPAISRLVSLEHDQMTHRWLRGAMSFLAFICFILSIIQVENNAGNIVLHILLLVLSLAGEVCIVFIYRIKARFAGVSNPASRTINPLHSPYATLMLVEMLLWIIMAPPAVSSKAGWAQVLDSLIILRSYVYVLYLIRLTTQSVFKRAIAAVCGYRFNSFYMFRHTFLSRHAFVTAAGFLVAWLGLALLYSKGENVSYGDAVYFCLSTTAFVAYGDIAPMTWVGRFVAFLAWCLGLLMIGWSVSLMHAVLKISPAERNLHTLFRTNKLCAQIPGEAARTIQQAWRLYVAKRDHKNYAAVQFNALLLSTQVCSFRRLRRNFVTAEMTFLRSTYTFEDTLTAMIGQSSRRSSPADTPRSPGSTNVSSLTGSLTTPRPGSSSRRPFALFKEVKAKQSPPLSRNMSKRELEGGNEDLHSSSTIGGPTTTTTTAAASVAAPAARASPPSLALRNPVRTSGDAGTAMFEITTRLSRLDETLNALIRKTERMVPQRHSTTEVVS